MTHLSSIELSRVALLHNVAAFKAAQPSPWFTAVVKANAYGHGMEEIVGMLGDEADAFQMDDLDELRRLRRMSDRWALVYGYVPLGDVEAALCLGEAELTVYDLDHITEIARVCAKHGLYPRFSLKIDAQLGRQGLLPDEIDAFLEGMAAYPDLEPTSVYAHYANIEDTTDLTHAEAQETAFQDAYTKLEARWPMIGRHLSATSGVLAREKTPPYNSMVRLGIGLYGLYPSAPLARSHAHLDLRPVMRWVTHLAQVKTLPAGHPVGYGLTYRTTRPTLIGIVPQGVQRRVRPGPLERGRGPRPRAAVPRDRAGGDEHVRGRPHPRARRAGGGRGGPARGAGRRPDHRRGDRGEAGDDQLRGGRPGFAAVAEGGGLKDQSQP